MRLYSNCIIAFAIMTLVAGCSKTAPAPAAGSYNTLTVKRQDYTLDRRLTAKIESKENVDISPMVGGTLKKIYVSEGARVKKGAPLFLIDPAPYIAAVDAAKAEVATARAALSTAQLNMEGKEQLYAREMIGEFDLRRARLAQEEATAQLETAQAALAEARANLDYTTIKSPVDGTVSMIDFLEGNVVFPSGELPITLVAANKHINAYTTLSEELFTNLLREYDCNTSQELLGKLPPVSLFTIWGDELPQKGHFDAISGDTDFLTGSILLRASFDNPSEMFRNGSNGHLMLPTTLHDVFVIPQEATLHIQDKYFVYRIIEGKVVMTEVKGIPAVDDEHLVVTDGLNDNDVIIADNVGMVREGMTVDQVAKKKGQ